MSNVIFLNGASSAGKSSIAKVLQDRLKTPFFRLSSDQLIEARVLPEIDRSQRKSPFAWSLIRPKFFDAFHRTVGAFADAGCDLVVDHVVEFPAWLDNCVEILARHRVFYVGVHCDLGELARRELARGDRRPGEARSHVMEDRIHAFSEYDFTVDTGRTSAETCARVIAEAWAGFDRESVFERRRRSN